jgi:hypothetical protein
MHCRYADLVPSSRLPRRFSGRPPSWRTGTAQVGYLLLASGAAALSAWQAQLSRDSPGAHWGVGLLVLAALATAIVLGRRRQRQTTRTWVAGTMRTIRAWRSQPTSAIVSVLIWTIVIGGFVGWDLVSFVEQSHALPTLSYFIGHVTRYRIGRGLVFALWLGVGAYIVAGYRTEAPR